MKKAAPLTISIKQLAGFAVGASLPAAAAIGSSSGGCTGICGSCGGSCLGGVILALYAGGNCLYKRSRQKALPADGIKTPAQP